MNFAAYVATSGRPPHVINRLIGACTIQMEFLVVLFIANLGKDDQKFLKFQRKRLNVLNHKQLLYLVISETRENKSPTNSSLGHGPVKIHLN